MIDIKLIRETPEVVKQALNKRGTNCDSAIDRILELDISRRNTTPPEGPHSVLT